MFLKFLQPKKHKKVVAKFDILDDNGLRELNALYEKDVHILREMDKTIPGVPGGFESDSSPAKLLRIVTYLENVERQKDE